MTSTIISSSSEKPDSEEVMRRLFAMMWISLVPRHDLQCHRQRKELIPFSVIFEFRSDGQHVRVRHTDATHDVHMPTHVIGSLQFAAGCAWSPDDVIHVVTGRWT